MNYSVAEENYIKTIFHLQGENNTVNTNALAQELDTRPASITDMLKKLKLKKLVHYQAYQGFRLTNEGRKVALEIIRRHRLWEFFLSEKLKFSWEEVHEVAEQLEHVSDKKLIDRLDEYLNFPKFDPHGDPIPDSSGKMIVSRQINLTDLPLNKMAEVCKVGNQSAEILDLLKHNKINIGTKLEVKKKFDFDNSMEIKIRQCLPITISEQLAKNIFVKYAS
ncbi:MAG TPA: metal-dependent transcriptional regulator [Chitinophagaceae bacterium]